MSDLEDIEPRNDIEFRALLRLFYDELIKVLKLCVMQAQVEENRTPTLFDLQEFVTKDILCISSSDNKLDRALFAMGADYEEIHPLVRDRLIFLRKFALCHIKEDEKRTKDLRAFVLDFETRLRERSRKHALL